MQVCSRCCHQWAITDKVIWAATVVIMLLLLLSILHCLGKVYNGTRWLCLQSNLGPHCQFIPPCWHSLPPGVPPMQKGSWLADCLWASTKERSSLLGAYLPWLLVGCGMVPLLPPFSLPCCLEIIQIPLSFHKGKKLIAWGLFVLAAGGLWDGSIASSFSASHATWR